MEHISLIKNKGNRIYPVLCILIITSCTIVPDDANLQIPDKVYVTSVSITNSAGDELTAQIDLTGSREHPSKVTFNFKGNLKLWQIPIFLEGHTVSKIEYTFTNDKMTGITITTNHGIERTESMKYDSRGRLIEHERTDCSTESKECLTYRSIFYYSLNSVFQDSIEQQFDLPEGTRFGKLKFLNYEETGLGFHIGYSGYQPYNEGDVLDQGGTVSTLDLEFEQFQGLNLSISGSGTYVLSEGKFKELYESEDESLNFLANIPKGNPFESSVNLSSSNVQQINVYNDIRAANLYYFLLGPEAFQYPDVLSLLYLNMDTYYLTSGFEAPIPESNPDSYTLKYSYEVDK